MDVLATAGSGLVAAGGRLAASAARVARIGAGDNVDLTRETVELIEARTAFKANLAVVRIADEMWSSLLELQVRSDRR
jgi:flagellar hook protein FlgE